MQFPANYHPDIICHKNGREISITSPLRNSENGTSPRIFVTIYIVKSYASQKDIKLSAPDW